MADISSSLDKQSAEIEQNLRLSDERPAEFVFPSDPANLLSANILHALIDALVSSGLATSDARVVLLQGIHAGFVASLHQAGNPLTQMRLDLATMNQVPALVDGEVPLKIWLSNAVSHLRSVGRVEAETFQAALNDLALTLSRSQHRRRRDADDSCPYRGLGSFHAKHARFFFGRDELIKELATVNQRLPVVIVVGPSGSGKSSVVRAGLLPWLEQSDQQWRSVVFTPGPDLTDALAQALVDLGGIESLVQRQEQISRLVALLKHDSATFRRSVADIANGCPDVSLLIVVDQFEELYRTTSNATVQRAFVDAIVQAASGNDRTHVIVIIRADFYAHVLQDPSLGPHVAGGLVNVLPLNKAELREAVEKPAGLFEVQFEPRLADTIVKDALGQPGYLPLLEYALTKLWDRRTSSGRLTFEAYEVIGGVVGALLQSAEKLYERYKELGKADVLERLFVRLVEAGEQAPKDTRRRVIRQELEEPFGDLSFPIWQIVEDLVNERLVVVDQRPFKSEETVEIPQDFTSLEPVRTRETTSTGEETVEIAHEALIREWSRLGTWVDQDRHFSRWRQSRLEPDLEAWQDEGKDIRHLLQGEPLTTAERWLKERPRDLNSSERNYIFRSIMQEESDLDQWMPLFTPQHEVLAFLDGYLISSKEDDQLKGIAGLKGLEGPELEVGAYKRLEGIILTYPSDRIRSQAAVTICRRGQIDKLAMLLRQQLDKDQMTRVVKALAVARNLPRVGKQVDDVVDSENRGRVRRAATLHLISSRRNEFAIVLFIAYLFGTVAPIVLSPAFIMIGGLFSISVGGNFILVYGGFGTFEVIITLGVLLYILIRKQQVDDEPLKRGDRVLAGLAAGALTLPVALLSFIITFGQNAIQARVFGEFSPPLSEVAAMAMRQLSDPLSEMVAVVAMCTLAVTFTPIISARLHVRDLVRTTLKVVLVAGLAAIVLSLLATQLNAYFLANYTESTSFPGFLQMVKLAVLNWIYASLVLLSTLIGFQYGIRIAFSSSIPPETPEITTETSTSRKRK